MCEWVLETYERHSRISGIAVQLDSMRVRMPVRSGAGRAHSGGARCSRAIARSCVPVRRDTGCGCAIAGCAAARSFATACGCDTSCGTGRVRCRRGFQLRQVIVRNR
jgi:hypothetical protein